MVKVMAAAALVLAVVQTELQERKSRQLTRGSLAHKRSRKKMIDNLIGTNCYFPTMMKQVISTAKVIKVNDFYDPLGTCKGHL